jgi:flagellar protein FliO/FliZ
VNSTTVIAGAASPASGLVHTAGALLVVLALIFVLAWLVRRVQNLRPAAAGGLRVQAGLQVGARERVLWLRAGDQHLLIGVAPGRVQTLHVFDRPPEVAEAEGSATAAAPSFQDLLKRALGKSS